MKSSNRKFQAPVWLLLVLLSVSVRAQPSVADLASRVSVDSLRKSIVWLAAPGGLPSRVTFTAGNDSARRWILRQFQRLPLDSVWTDTFFVRAARAPYDTVPQFNVLAQLTGRTNPRDVWVLGAHYDCSGSHEPGWSDRWQAVTAPGADDNATGVAILLETARVMSEAGWRPEATVLFAAFAAEEYTPTVPSSAPDSLRHHLGSAALAAKLASEGLHVLGLVNVDMIGYNPDTNYVEFVADAPSQKLAHLGRSLIRELDLNLLCNEPPFLYNTFSDHESFVRWGFPAVLLMENDRPWRDDWPFYTANPNYHSSRDVPGVLNWDQVEAVARLALGMTVELASARWQGKDVVPPAQPTLLRAVVENDSVRLHWTGDPGADFGEVRVYTPDVPWLLPDQPAAVATLWKNSLTVPAANGYVRCAVTLSDAAALPNESTRTDCYAAGVGPRGRVLVVDGFDRWGGSGSWGRPYHWFATTYTDALQQLGFGVETCANECVVDGSVDLRSYDAVFWFLGDESTRDETFSAAEQRRVREYLQGGGRLFVSGSEIGWDLGRKGSGADRAFLREVLHCTYVADDAKNYRVRGVSGSVFEGLSFPYGEIPYEEDYPDVLAPASGAKLAFVYGNGRGAGVSFAGSLSEGLPECRLVVLGFPLETLASDSARRAVVERVLTYFGLLGTSVASHAGHTGSEPVRLAVRAYPNPFNAATAIRVRAVPGKRLRVRIWNARGRLVATLLDQRVYTADISLRWRADGLASGLYVVEAVQGTRR
ncbi:MAG: M20/M25/M40 family metallo-hydrolase, partial [Calditrichaeota bacterium]|nr:M20/M25/M40 family metallo-hydrolase [Calditrichota bacterium]